MDRLSRFAKHWHHDLVPGPGSTIRPMDDHKRSHSALPPRDSVPNTVATSGHHNKGWSDPLDEAETVVMRSACPYHRPVAGATPDSATRASPRHSRWPGLG